MYRLIRYYNQNRKKILWIILIIVFIIAIIQILNFFAKKNNGSNNSKKESVVSNITYSNAVTSNKSSVTGSEISQDKLKKDTDIIDTFFNYCNEGDVEDAYELLNLIFKVVFSLLCTTSLLVFISILKKYTFLSFESNK